MKVDISYNIQKVKNDWVKGKKIKSKNNYHKVGTN